MKDITEFKTDIFTLFDRGWALLTAGTQERWNTMTVSWGALGTLWGLPAATVYVKPVRYTHRFMDAGDIFTLAFFFGERRGDLSLLGTKLGREVNKVALTSLTPVEIEGGMSFKEAPLYRLQTGKKVDYLYSDKELRKAMDALDAEGKKAAVQRYKGLGEMNPSQLWETTMDPATRLLKQIELDDLTGADEYFDILMGDRVEPRREFIEQHAHEVHNLDV